MMSCLKTNEYSLADLEWLITEFREGLICKTSSAWEIVSQINILVRRADNGMRWHSLLGPSKKKSPELACKYGKGCIWGLLTLVRLDARYARRKW
jgi:hypothetical protein